MIPAMSLATRCTACGTIFRVVQDQLRVSEGWVRCGRCAEVFDAREQLFDIDHEAPPPWPAEAPLVDAEPEVEQPIAPLPEPLGWQPPPSSGDAGSHGADEALAAESPLRSVIAPAEPDETDLPAPVVEPMYAAEPPLATDPATDSRLEPQWIDEEQTVVIAPLPAPPEPADIPIDAGPDVVLAPGLATVNEDGKAGPDTPLPSFMRQAERAQRWRRPGVRVALGACALALLALLGLQTAYHFRDAIAANYPEARPGLQALCELSACELHPWRNINALSVVSSALNPAGPGHQYQLTVSLHNKSKLEVATPWIELNLTDAAGTVVMRRMLAPTDFKNAKPAMAGGAELPLQLLLSTGEQGVAGYSVEIFHP